MVLPTEKVPIGRHYTVPQSSPRFTGRVEELTRLEHSFFSSQQVIPRQRRAVLYGLGGSGKTQIALGFAEKYTERCGSSSVACIPRIPKTNLNKDSIRSFG